MTYVQQSKAMKGYDCATFDEGCPSVNYFSDEAYKCKKFKHDLYLYWIVISYSIKWKSQVNKKIVANE